MRQNLGRAFAFLFGAEGYVSNNAHDKGKLTIFGVASRWWPNEVAAMLKMTPEAAREYAKAFYLTHYWLPAGCDRLPWPADLAVFDAAVQHDAPDARRFWDECDGTWQGMIARRREYYRLLIRNPDNAANAHGWMNRMDNLEKYIAEHP